MKKRVLNRLLRRYNKIRFTKPKTVELIPINPVDRRTLKVYGDMLKNIDPPKLSIWPKSVSKGKIPKYYLLEGSHRSQLAKIQGRPIVLKRASSRTPYKGGGDDPRAFFKTIGLPKYYLLEGSHRSQLAKIQGRPIVLKRASSRTPYKGGGDDPRAFYDTLKEKTEIYGKIKILKHNNWYEKPIRVKTVRLKKHTKESRLIKKKVGPYLKKRKLKWKGTYDAEDPQNTYKINKRHRKKISRLWDE